MRLLCALVALPLLAGPLAAGGEKTKWVKISPEGANCEILFPAKPKEMPGKGMTQFLLEREGGKAALLLQIQDLPKELDIGNAAAVKLALDAGRDALKTLFKGGKLLVDKDVKVNGKYPGRDVDIDIPDLGIYRVRMILTGPKLYQVTALGPKDYLNGAEAKKFRGSFKLKG
jgi:hypothetical protein